MTLEEIQSRLVDDDTYHSNILKKVEKIILLLFQNLKKSQSSLKIVSTIIKLSKTDEVNFNFCMVVITIDLTIY
jgi:hypothetical protein